ncbi:IS66 family insertion sequence element accessory protein TnpB [Mesorhizobium sp. LSJC264A00]|uniref:IS66 family insertion sequence element accessory protein TnpB n=1 Tax=unclassified Mesorhizobium TaxID=325217 RepID=UPI0032AF33E2
MGHTDMRKGMQGLALLVQQHLKRDPHGGDLYVFRGRAGSLVKTSGMTGSVCRFMPSGSRRAASFGPR